MKKVAETIILFGTALGLAANAPAQETPPASETAEAAPAAEAPPAPELEAPAPEAPVPELEAPAPEASAPEAPAPADGALPALPADPQLPAESSPALPATEPSTAPAIQPSTNPEADAAAFKAQILASGQQMIAERLVEFAQGTIRDAQLDPAAFRHAASLIRAAVRLNKNDPRSWRLLIELELQLGNREGALAALKSYRSVVPDDFVAQVQLIELYASGIEAADKEVAYLRSLVGKETIPPEVRSHVAVMAARVLIERGEQASVAALLDEAIKLNPVNVSALDMKYQLMPADLPLSQQVAGLLAVLRGNPIRPAELGHMGRLFAQAGMAKEAVDWMGRSLALYARSTDIDANAYHDLAIDYSAQQYILGQYQLARTSLDQFSKVSPNDVDIATLQLLLERGGADPALYEKARASAEAVLAARWSQAAKFIADDPAATQPVDPAAAPAPAADAPQPADVAKQVQAANDEAKQDAFVAAAADYAWFEIYFNQQPGNAGKWINALETVLPEDNVTLKRLRGWLALASNQPDEARQVLGAIRDTDPLAALGMLQIEAPAGDKAGDDAARKLLAAHPSGLVGAILTQAFRDRQLKPEPHPEVAAIRAELKKFDRSWLDIAGNPERFYSIRVEPLGGRIAHRYGEPIYVRVILQNISNHPISIGENGVVRPTLWFDAEVQAMNAQRLNGVALDRMTMFSLPPRAGIAQFVRIDQGDLLRLLAANPTPRLQVTGWCITNPAQQEKGYGPGPGGYRVPFNKKMTRVGFVFSKPETLNKLFEELQQGLPDMKMRNISLLAAYAKQFRGMLAPPEPLPPDASEEKIAEREKLVKQQQENADKINAQLEPLLENMSIATNDEMTSVAQWAKFELARVGQPETQQEWVDSLLADPAWEGRLLGVIATQNLPSRKAALERLAKVTESATEDEGVKSYAAELAMVLNRSTTQPDAEQPVDAAAPAGEPAPETENPAPETK